jgi:hypothetical protein
MYRSRDASENLLSIPTEDEFLETTRHKDLMFSRNDDIRCFCLSEISIVVGASIKDHFLLVHTDPFE